MTALQQIIKEAQSIRRKSPKMEWKKAVAQASAIYANKHKGISPVGKKKVVKKAAKKVAKKKVVGKYVKTVRTGKITDVIYKRKKIGAVKRKPTEKAVLKSIKHAVSVQKSHMGNVNKHALEDYQKILNRINIAKFAVLFNDEQSKLSKRNTETYKAFIKDKEKAKAYLKELETHAKELKKHI
jgi:hypothetical protein